MNVLIDTLNKNGRFNNNYVILWNLQTEQST